MACGSDLIKDAAERDGLVEESGNKCVEMEEAELTSELPASLFSARCFISPVSVRHIVDTGSTGDAKWQWLSESYSANSVE
jgi:hypothetical protein